MFTNRTVYLNGTYVAWDKATVHIMSHSIGRGSAIFEVLSLHATERGSVIFRLQDHISRLFRSAALLDMELPLPEEECINAVLGTVKRNSVDQGYIKIICYYPQISFEILPPQKQLAMAIFIIDPEEDLPQQGHLTDGRSSLCISTWAKLDGRTVPVGAKVAANYLNGMMARQEAVQRGFDFSIMLDTEGFIAEGGTESIFLVSNGTIMTPALGTVLDSITRKSILEASAVHGIAHEEGRIPPELLSTADEIFLSGTPAKVLPVSRMEDRVIDNTPGPVTRKMSSIMEDIVTGRDGRFAHWLFPVE
jgi:branched-chain amino acid aminotransferase